MTTSVDTLLTNISSYQFNPAGIQRTVLNMLTELTDGEITVVDPTNPFVFCLESAAVMTAAFMAKNETNTRRQYPASAQTAEDLYLHMSDKDYIDRFASPSKTVFSLLISKTEAIDKMVLDPISGIRKLVIPRNTYFTVADTVFSLQYPIEIRQLQHGGLQVVYDADAVSPLQALQTNVIDWEIRKSAEGDYLYFSFEVQQFKITSQTGSANLATDFKLDIPVEDQFYYARVYMEDSSKQWREIATTHTDQIYNPATPTAVLRVADGVLTTRIPQIYVSNGTASTNVRVDVYQTKGALEMMLQNYPISAYTVTWKAYDKADDTVYSAPLKTLRQLIVFSDQLVTGGKDPLSFEDLRYRVINNATGAQQLPITNVQLSSALANQGYEIVKNIDVITNRVFLATRNMPDPMDAKLITAAATSIETLTVSIDEISALAGVRDNSDSVTITPDVIYKITNGVVKLVNNSEVQQLLAMSGDQRALAVSNGNYLYTPFHYVLDMADDEFAVRPYYLDSPSVITKLFVSENDTTLLQVTTQSYDLVRTSTGYKLRIVTKSSDDFKAITDSALYVQLAYVPEGERDRAYLMGELVAKSDEGERTYEFDLSTNFNVDGNDCLELTEFLLYNQEPRLTKTPLVGEFDIIYSTTALISDTWVSAAVDAALGRFLLPSTVYGVAHERLRLSFGQSLRTLWSRARSVVSSAVYKTWAADVPRLYEQDIYQTDLDTGAAFSVNAQGELEYTILHHKGDVVTDADGNPSLLHRAGEIELDHNGVPIVVNPRGMLRQLDVFLIEGAYWFATDGSAVNYRFEMTNAIVSWLTQELSEINKQLLEQTRLYFYPKTTLGTIPVMIKDGQTTSIEAGQALRVQLYVNKTVFANDELRSQLSLTTIKTISELLKKTTVSVSEIQSTLRTQYGQDVIDVQLTGLGGGLNLPALTVFDDSDRCSIRKRLVVLPDDTLIVQEDIVLDFIRHEVVI